MAECATVARPYAKALYDLAQKHQTQRAWLSKLSVMAQLVCEPRVATLISSPMVTSAERSATLLDLFSSTQLDTLLKNFVSVLSENGRLSILPEIYQQYSQLVLAQERIRQAVIYSAFPLEGKELEELVATLEQQLNAKLQVTVEIEPALIGGVKVAFGDQVLDMSVQSKLNALSAAITS